MKRIPRAVTQGKRDGRSIRIAHLASKHRLLSGVELITLAQKWSKNALQARCIVLGEEPEYIQGFTLAYTETEVVLQPIVQKERVAAQKQPQKPSFFSFLREISS